ncbi:MAG: glycosyltransferase family 4 protein [Deltaproteobacteria bacterium]|nr:glycosyltransferase family 4 protein [Deltaproteobacteria bacterium]
MKKILIATDRFLPGWDGISSFLNEILPRMSDDYQITVLAPDFGKLKIKYKAKVIRFKVLRIKLGDNYRPIVNPFKIFSEVKKTDILWAHTIGPIAACSILAANKYHKPILFYQHTIEWEVFPNSQDINLFKSPIGMATKVMGRLLLNLCNVIIVSSHEQAEILDFAGIRRMKRVVHPGVDIKRYKQPKNKTKAKIKAGLDPSKFVVGYAGRLSLEKDPETLYRAFLRLAEKHNDVFLLIAGGGREGLEKLFSARANVFLTGLKDNLVPYYQAMDVYVLPSLSETTSLTTMEAMASGVPVITTPVGLVKEYVVDGENGFLFSKKNPYELFTKIEYLKNNPVERANLGKIAHKTIVENYSWEKTVKGVKGVIDSL